MIDAIEPEAPPRKGHWMFHQLLRRLGMIHAEKGRDYGSPTDPLANIKAASEFGVDPWRMALAEMEQCNNRVKAFCRRKETDPDKWDNALMDLASYALLTLCLRHDAGLLKMGPEVKAEEMQIHD